MSSSFKENQVEVNSKGSSSKIIQNTSRRGNSFDINEKVTELNNHRIPKDIPSEGSVKEVDYQRTSIGDHGRRGLTTPEVETIYGEVGYNELESIEISPFQLFLLQFTGLMPYILEACCILSLSIQDYIDFAIIFIILLSNASLGYSEEIKAKKCLDELTDKMEHKIAVVRDGRAQQILTRLLVPGDVVLLVGGTTVPADLDWLEGDVLSIDTAALTGESIPRKYPSQKYGLRIYCGTTVVSGEAYCIVRKTGSATEIGSSHDAVMKDKIERKTSVFESRVLLVVQATIICSITIIIVILLVQGIARDQFRRSEVEILIQSILSLLVASVPVALPLVLQVTMALGASHMAQEYDAVVTSLPALQDISSMTILCSDKTGTLTTARISIHENSIWCAPGFYRHQLVFYSRLASNPDKEDDPIDRSCIEFFDRNATAEDKFHVSDYRYIRNLGFNSVYKRVVWEYYHKKYGRILIAKGLPNKVIDTADGGQDDADDQWKVENHVSMMDQVTHLTNELSKQGYKTLGLAIKAGNEPFRFVGILPMIDPPRHDTARTINRLMSAGVQVKMVTGDHQNIAIETSRLIGMGTNILGSDELRNENPEIRSIIESADGFSQVLPKDKRTIVEVLKSVPGAVIGMTGDGVNDVPALSAAQCGIAVHNSTDAAKSAASIILTTPGLSAVYSAIVESRRIFRKLRSYIVYRIGATIQIVLSLSLIIFITNCQVKALLIILLALFNDLTLLPIAYDVQQPSAKPDVPSVRDILILSVVLGGSQTIFTLLWTYVSQFTHFFYSNLNVLECSLQSQAGIWVELVVSTELLIFSTRASSFLWNSSVPSYPLIASVLLGSIILSVFAIVVPTFGYLVVTDVLIIWLYVIITILVVDVIKVLTFYQLGEKFDVLQYTTVEAEEKELSSARMGEGKKVTGFEESKEIPDIELGDKSQYIESPTVAKEKDEEVTLIRTNSALRMLDDWIARSNQAEESPTELSQYISEGVRRPISSSEVLLEEANIPKDTVSLRRTTSAPGALRRRFAPPTADEEARVLPPTAYREGKIVVSADYSRHGSWFELRRRSFTRGSIRPNIPANLTLPSPKPNL